MKIYHFLILSLVFNCFIPKNNLLWTFLRFSQKSEETKKSDNRVEVDFSSISANLHDVLAYKKKKKTTDALVNFLLSEEAKNEGWNEIPSSKKIEIQKGQELELSLGGVVPLGKKKIDAKTNLTLVSVMGNEQKVKNFKYLALSLSSKKIGKLAIESSDLEKLKNKIVNFEKSYENFKQDKEVTTALEGKTLATDKEVSDYSTKGKEPVKPIDPELKSAPILSNQVGDTKLKISWSAVAGTEKYKIYYGESTNCNKSKKVTCTMKEQTETSLTLNSLTNGTEYTFFVVGLDSSDKQLTNLSQEAVVKPKTKIGFFITSEGSIKIEGMRVVGTRSGFSGGNLGGIAGADAQCKRLAEAASLGGRTWKAFLFTTTEDPHNRIGAGPWYNIDKAKIGDNVQALRNQNSTTAFLNLLKDEKGAKLTMSTHDIMIGGDGRGGQTTMANTCNNWTSDDSNLSGVAIGHASTSDRNNNRNVWLTDYGHSGRGSCSPGGISGEMGAGKFYCFASDSNPQDF